ncbi:MAG: LacI family DNA-binding transcriptional regulator [Opitutales bacterium]|nr:LacI family DNA-binding transcriptional regulator [Opitutales bacterium]
MAKPSRKRPVTQASIAKEAGVSVSAVSLALRAHPSIPVATRRRIEAIARKQGYQQDAQLSKLMSYLRSASRGRTRPVVAYVNQFEKPAMHRFGGPPEATWKGLCDRADQLGYKIEEFWMGDRCMSWKRLRQVLEARGIGGIIFDTIIDRDIDFPMDSFVGVMLNQTRVGQRLHTVGCNIAFTGFKILNQLRRAGLKRIGYLHRSGGRPGARFGYPQAFSAFRQEVPPADRLPMLNVSDPHHVNPVLLAHYVQEWKPDFVLSDYVIDESTCAEAARTAGRTFMWAYIDYLGSMSGYAGIDQKRSTVGFMGMDILDAHLRRNETGVPAFQKTLTVEGTWMPGRNCPVEVDPEHGVTPAMGGDSQDTVTART